MGKPAHSLRFLGGTGTVTGSKYLFETEQSRVLVDCGLFQGLKNLRVRNRHPLPVPAESLDAVVLTHAHLDHSGYVPSLVRQGFRGPLVMTTGTAELCSIVWPDSAHLLAEEAERANRKGTSRHEHAEPLYTIDDVNRALELVKTVDFDTDIPLRPDITARFLHAGHILGASQAHLTVGSTRVHFTGDLGRPHDALMNPPADLIESDILITESTYGDRTRPHIDSAAEIAEAFRPVLERHGVVVIPAFAIGRTQELLLHLYRLMRDGALPKVPVYVNSPMASHATEMYHRHLEEHQLAAGEFEAIYDYAHMVESVADSKALNERHGPMIIIAGSGMMTGGRVLHHIRAFGSNPRNAIVIAGYQAEGTRGRLLADGASTLRIFGDDVPIGAEVIELSTMSAHADADEILEWMRSAPTAPRMTFVTHGEPSASDRLRFRIQDELGWNARVPLDGERIDLDAL